MSRIHTAFGDIFEPDGPCKDDYHLIEEADTDRNHGLVKLQAGAMNSFHAAERRVYQRLHPLKAHRFPNRVFTIHVTGSWRSCELQHQLYDSDNNRYADPDVTLHTRGLAIDVSTLLDHQPTIRAVLLGHGWNQSRPDDEPWHYSYHFTA